MFVFLIVLVFQVVSSDACSSEASTIIQIKNYEGPIYLHAPQTPCEEKVLHHLPSDYDCSCVSKPSSTSIPLNTATQCTSLYNPPCPTSYQDTGLYYPYQGCPAQSGVYCAVPQDEYSYACGKCGRRLA